MGFEGPPKPKQLSEVQIGKIEKQRLISDTELVKAGAERDYHYFDTERDFDERGKVEIVPTREQIEIAREEMGAALKMNESMELNPPTETAKEVAVENLEDDKNFRKLVQEMAIQDALKYIKRDLDRGIEDPLIGRRELSGKLDENGALLDVEGNPVGFPTWHIYWTEEAEARGKAEALFGSKYPEDYKRYEEIKQKKEQEKASRDKEEASKKEPSTEKPEAQSIEKSLTEKEFDKVSEREQIQRYLDLKSLFGEMKGKEDRAKYSDFFENVYKYTDRFKIEGLGDQEKKDLFADATGGNRIISKALDIFLEAKRNPNRAENQMEMAMSRIISEGHFGFVDPKTEQLDVEKLTKLFSWSLKVFIAGGETIGRTPPKFSPEEIERMSMDMETILRQVNQFREKSKETKEKALTDKGEAVEKAAEKSKPKEIKTAKGSIYQYLPDGRTQRYKTVEKKWQEPMDTLTFIPPWDQIKLKAAELYPAIFGGEVTQADYEQILLDYVQGKDKVGEKSRKTVRLIDENGKEVKTNQDVANAKQVFIHFIDRKDPKNNFMLPVSKEPKLGHMTFDTKYTEKDGNVGRVMHIGNEVSEIAYEK